MTARRARLYYVEFDAKDLYVEGEIRVTLHLQDTGERILLAIPAENAQYLAEDLSSAIE